MMDEKQEQIRPARSRDALDHTGWGHTLRPPRSQPEEATPVYTLRVYVAAPGTPIKDGAPSVAGHMYYSVSDGNNVKGYGFSPVVSEMSGPGQVVRDEYKNYEIPRYSRTLEITAEQYQKLQAFGEAGVKGSEEYFNLNYNGMHNSCVDFVWTGLNQAGLHRSIPGFRADAAREDKGYEGALKPTHNIQDIQRIRPPVPDSPHNAEEHNPMPERTWLQRALSRTEGGTVEPLDGDRLAAPALTRIPVPSWSSGDRWVDALLASAHTPGTLDRTLRAFANSAEGEQWMAHGRAQYAQQESQLAHQNEAPAQAPRRIEPLVRTL